MILTTKEDRQKIDRHVGSRVRHYRLLLNTTQEKLGKAIGLTFQQVQKYEMGDNRISASTLFAIAQALDVSVLSFYEGLEDAAGNTIKARHENSASIQQAKRVMADFSRIQDPDLRQLVQSLVFHIANTEEYICKRIAGSDIYDTLT